MVLLEGSYCLLGPLARHFVCDPNAAPNGPIYGISDDLWDALAEWYRTQ